MFSFVRWFWLIVNETESAIMRQHVILAHNKLGGGGLGVAKVFLNIRSTGKRDWNNEFREFARVPVVGEYFALDSSSEWYDAQLVLHTIPL